MAISSPGGFAYDVARDVYQDVRCRADHERMMMAMQMRPPDGFGTAQLKPEGGKIVHYDGEPKQNKLLLLL
jgi:hypothetical protein